MYRDYKVYYNDSYLLISAQRPQMNEKFSKVIEGDEQLHSFSQHPDFLFNGTMNTPVLVLSDKPGEVMCDLMEQLDIIVAGGGIVWNEHHELLLIFRRGKWDLPKGKIELNEKIKDGARREVEEETGVVVTEVNDRPVITYHAYLLKNKYCLKQTEWFTMKARAGQDHLTPQTEEDIEQALWVPRHQIAHYREGCYPLVWDLIKDFATA